MKIKKCAVCGALFESHYGILVCSEKCKEERRRKQYSEANFRRRNGLSNIPRQKECPVCGKIFDAFKNMEYCGKYCYEKVRSEKARENSREYYSDSEWKRKHIENVRRNKERKAN